MPQPLNHHHKGLEASTPEAGPGMDPAPGSPSPAPMGPSPAPCPVRDVPGIPLLQECGANIWRDPGHP